MHRTFGPLELAVIDVDRDDRARARNRCAEDRGVTDAAAPDDGHGLAAAYRCRVHRGAKAGHHPAAEQAGDLWLHRRVDLGALAGGDQGLGGERTDPERGRQRRTVLERHLLAGVVGCEAVPGLAAVAGAAVATDGTPVQDDEVTGRDVGDPLADGGHDTRSLMPEQERELVVDAALAVVQVGVADAARLDVDQRLARARDRAPRWS